MVTNHLRAPYGIYFTKHCTILLWSLGTTKLYLKIYGTHTAFCRVMEDKVASAGHSTVPRQPPFGVSTHRTGTRWLSLKFKSYDFNDDRPSIVRCPAGHCSMSVNCQELLIFFKRIGRCPSVHQIMPFRAPVDVLLVELPPGKKRRVCSEVHIATTYILFHFNTRDHGYRWGWITCNEQVLLQLLLS